MWANLLRSTPGPDEEGRKVKREVEGARGRRREVERRRREVKGTTAEQEDAVR